MVCNAFQCKCVHQPFRSILRDPVVFPNPQDFHPARFLNNERAVEVTSSIFGFGRRCVLRQLSPNTNLSYAAVSACPGTYFAAASMFIAIATALSQCNISDPIDIQGSKISKDVELRPGMIRYVCVLVISLVLSLK